MNPNHEQSTLNRDRRWRLPAVLACLVLAATTVVAAQDTPRRAVPIGGTAAGAAPPVRGAGEREAIPRTAPRPVLPSTSPLPPLPEGWSSRDIGADVPGGAGHAAGQYHVTGAGPDIWGTADGFRFVYRTLTGDGEIVARVESLQRVDAWSKGGVMMRESLTPQSRHATMLVSAAQGVAFQRRAVIGGHSLHSAGGDGTAPQFLRLIRSGTTFHAYRSIDGMQWSHVGSQSIPMAETIHVGLAVSSHQAGVPALATFSHVDVRAGTITPPAQPAPTPPPAPAPPAPSAPAPAAPGESPPAAAPAPSNPAPESPPPSSSSGRTLRLLHWNIQHGTGTDRKYDLDRLATWMAKMQPDVISLNEVEQFSPSWGNEDQPEIFAALLRQKTGHRWYVHFAQRSGQWSSNGQGNAILSRFPFTQTDQLRLSCNRSAALAGIQVNGRTITLLSTHLDLDSDCRTTQVSQLLAWFRYHPDARIMAGDWNAQASSSHVTSVTQTYHDAWAAAAAAGSAIDYPGNSRFGATRNSRIDYVFYSKSASTLTLRSAQVYDTRDTRGEMPSDHKPLVVTFEIR